MKNQTKTINIDIVPTDDGFAYDVAVIEENATIGDYIRLLDDFLEEKVAPCLGCDLCCKQRIPLTLPDIYGYAGQSKDDIAAFLKEKAEICFSGGAIDIKLAQRVDGSCIYLDTENQRCLDHPHRSLVCHTYICLPQTQRARELREELINLGEDALVAALFDLGILADEKRCGNYPIDGNWQGKAFEEIKLKDVLSPSVYTALR